MKQYVLGVPVAMCECDSADGNKLFHKTGSFTAKSDVCEAALTPRVYARVYVYSVNAA